MSLSQFTSKIPRPSVIIITGRRGSGKDVTACALAEEIHKQTDKPVYSNYDPEQFSQLPKYWKLRRNPDFTAKEYCGTIQLVSDAHLDYFSRDWQSDLAGTLVKVVSISRHRDIDIIYTTQMTSLLDRQVVSNIDVFVVKEPSLLAPRMERPEIRDLTQGSAPFFEGRSQKEKWETAVCYTHETAKPTIVTGIKRPAWFSEEMSKIFAGDTPEEPVWERIL